MKPKDWTHLHPQYAGKWVAFDKDEETVVASGKSIKKVFQEARRKGVEIPYLFKVPTLSLPYVGHGLHGISL